MHHNIPQSTALICTQQANSQLPARAVGCFKLSARHAMSLTPNVPGELRITHGRVWVTFGHAADDADARAGDYFLDTGDLMRLAPGQQLVVEVHHPVTGQQRVDPAYFSWEPDAATSKVAPLIQASYTRCDVQQPLHDLGSALRQAGKAMDRLVQAAAGNLVCMLCRDHMTAR